MTIINRSATITDTTKRGDRILEGVAFSWDSPELASDDGRTSYLEEFARSCADRSLGQRPKFPLGILHPWSPNARPSQSPIPIGAVSFAPAAEGLMFIARVSKTAAGDDALELYDDGALGDVSIGAKAIRNTQRPSARGTVVRREEIAIRELSLAPPGMGQRPEAKVLVSRAGDVHQPRSTPLLDEYRRRALLL